MTIEEYLRGGDARRPVGIENAAKALKETKELLGEMGIRMFLAFGTCLGLYRDGEFIKWDWDNDAFILGEELVKFDRDLVLKRGFTELKVKRDIPRWKRADGEMSKDLYVRTISFKKYGVRVDLDPAYISECETKRIILKGRKREQFAAVHPAEWFAEPSELEYRGEKYLMPSSTDDYLHSNYGPNWRTPAFGPMPWSKRPCMSQEYECQEV